MQTSQLLWGQKWQGIQTPNPYCHIPASEVDACYIKMELFGVCRASSCVHCHIMTAVVTPLSSIRSVFIQQCWHYSLPVTTKSTCGNSLQHSTQLHCVMSAVTSVSSGAATPGRATANELAEKFGSVWLWYALKREVLGGCRLAGRGEFVGHTGTVPWRWSVSMIDGEKQCGNFTVFYGAETGTARNSLSV